MQDAVTGAATGRLPVRRRRDGLAQRYGPAEDVAAINAMVDATAYAAKTADPNESRTLDQLGAPGWSTSASNLGMLCPSCHNAKTHAGWHL
jgi:hypothetical protein